jgi:hypothetical protein
MMAKTKPYTEAQRVFFINGSLCLSALRLSLRLSRRSSKKETGKPYDRNAPDSFQHVSEPIQKSDVFERWAGYRQNPQRALPTGIKEQTVT